MIRSFATQATEDIFNGRSTKVARRTCPQNLWSIAGRKLDQLDSVVDSESRRGTAWNSCPEVDGTNSAFGLMTDTESAFAGRKWGLRT